MKLRWSPDAQCLAFLGWSEREEGHLYLYDVREDQRVPLGERVVADAPRWSPQGRYLAWISSSPSAAQVVVFDVASGEKVTFPAPDVSGSLRWSSDERYVAWRTASGFTFAAMEDLTVESMVVQSSSVRDWAFGEDVVVSLEALSGQIRLVSRAGEVPVDHLGDLDLNDFRWLQVRWVQ
jgi:Tol biopolymer transport system component